MIDQTIPRRVAQRQDVNRTLRVTTVLATAVDIRAMQ
jgi:hypothetical protein